MTLLQQQYGLTVTRSGLVHAAHRPARQAHPTYDALCAMVRGSPMVTPDETGWKVAGQLQWLWTFATPTTTVYRIQPGRGFDEGRVAFQEQVHDIPCRLTQITLDALTLDRVVRFLQRLEDCRHNHRRCGITG